MATTFDGESTLTDLAVDRPPRELYRGALEITSARWGPGGQIYVLRDPGSGGEIHRIARPGAAPVVLVSGIELGRYLAVSDDGRRLLYHREQHTQNLERLDRASGRIEPVTHSTAVVNGAALAPDGRTVALTVREGRRYSILIGPLDAGVERRRLDCAGPCSSPAWSPDSERLALRRRVDGAWRIAVIDRATGAETIMERVQTTHETLPALRWLSSTEILYMTAFNEELRVVEVGGADRPLVQPSSGGWMFHPVVSADRRRVAFFWNGARGRGAFIADRDGAGPRMVARGLWYPLGFDGEARLVVAEMLNDDSVGAIATVPVSGGEPEPFWTAPRGYVATDALAVSGSGDVLLLHHEPRSDVWLIENP